MASPNNATATSMPPAKISGTRAARQVWPCVWMRMLVSRPTTVVVCGVPERTSRHMGELFNG